MTIWNIVTHEPIFWADRSTAADRRTRCGQPLCYTNICPSVRLSVTLMICDHTVCAITTILVAFERLIHLVFGKLKMCWGVT